MFLALFPPLFICLSLCFCLSSLDIYKGTGSKESYYPCPVMAQG
jgi:hypothetical protein